MRVDMAVCAQEVHHRPDGLIDVLGVGINEVLAPAFPLNVRYAVVVRVVFVDEAEATTWHRLRVRLLLDGALLSPLPAVPFKATHWKPTATSGVNLIVNVTVGIPHPGSLLTELLIDGDHRLPQLRMEVRPMNAA